jgi:hypothetical protein
MGSVGLHLGRGDWPERTRRCGRYLARQPSASTPHGGTRGTLGSGPGPCGGVGVDAVDGLGGFGVADGQVLLGDADVGVPGEGGELVDRLAEVGHAGQAVAAQHVRVAEHCGEASPAGVASDQPLERVGAQRPPDLEIAGVAVVKPAVAAAAQGANSGAAAGSTGAAPRTSRRNGCTATGPGPRRRPWSAARCGHGRPAAHDA